MNFIVRKELFNSLKSKGQLKILFHLVQNLNKDNTVYVDSEMIEKDIGVARTYFYELMRRMEKDGIARKTSQIGVYMLNPEKIKRFDAHGGIEDDYKKD